MDPQVAAAVTVTHCWSVAPVIVPPVPEIDQAYWVLDGAQCSVTAPGHTVAGPLIVQLGGIQQTGAVPLKTMV